MVDTDAAVEFIVHSVAMIVASVIVLSAIGAAYGRLAIWQELLVITVIVLLYRVVTRRLGVAPDAWAE